MRLPFVLLILLIAGCTTAPPAAPTVVPPSPSPSAMPTAALPTATARPAPAPATPTALATEAATLQPPTTTPTVTAEPTNTPRPTETFPAETPTPLAGAGDLGQAPYAASDCSGEYPCNDDVAGWEARMRVPAGYETRYFARVEGNPTSITFGPGGLLYVAVQQGMIYAVDQDGESNVYVEGFDTPTGIAFQPGTERLYVSDRLVNENVGGESQISVVEAGQTRQIIDGLPCCYSLLHAAQGIAFGPDGYGYVGVGARADHGEILSGPNASEQDELHPLEASILRFSPDGGEVEVYARGLRNPYDIAWDGDGRLFATDNSPDFDPPEELHRVVPGGEHGYPWYICGGCFPPPPGVTIIPPVTTFIPSSAPTGITAYLAEQFPDAHNDLFVTLWSSFPGAQQVVRLEPGGTDARTFATGFAEPIDVTVGPQGSLYVADYATGIVFEISNVRE